MSVNLPASARGRYNNLILNSLDLFTVILMVFLTILVVPGLGLHNTRQLWLIALVSYVPVWMLARSTTYNQNRNSLFMEHVVANALYSGCAYIITFLALTTFLGLNRIAAFAYLVVFLMVTAGLCLERLLVRAYAKRAHRTGRHYVPTVIIGVNPTADRLLEEMKKNSGFGYRVLGFVDNEKPADFEGPYLCDLDELDEYLEDYPIEHSPVQIFYTYTAGHNNDLSKSVKMADRHMCQFFYVPRLTRFVSRKYSLHNIGSVPVLSSLNNPLSNPLNRFAKRTFDIIVSGLFLLFYYPFVYLPIAVLIKRDSEGPVYFKQKRTGINGQEFMCYKFRTMRPNLNSDTQQATRDDDRKTKVGEFLRKTSLDELPQFINVFKGEMSLVGPRPHMLMHTEEYAQIIDRYMVRHMVKPGITGWAQVNGFRGITDELWKMEKRVEHDVWYIENWSFLLDLKIMVRTVLNAVRGEENAF